jgi:hypothetical protein
VDGPQAEVAAAFAVLEEDDSPEDDEPDVEDEDPDSPDDEDCEEDCEDEEEWEDECPFLPDEPLEPLPDRLSVR